MPVSTEFMQTIRTLYPWMTPALINVYETSWSEFEDTELARQEVRQTSEYTELFPGNYDLTSGSVRMDEGDYFAAHAAFEATLISVGVNPEFFQDDWQRALEGEVSPREMTSRIESIYERVLDQAPGIKAYYLKIAGILLSDSAIIATALNPKIGDAILNREITMAEIGGEAAMRGFDIPQAMAQELFQAQLGRTEAASLFGQAATDLPALDVLARRHADPDDTFDLEEFITAGIYDDPQQRRRMRRLIAQEKSLFGNTTGTVQLRSNVQGGRIGLRAQ